MFRLKANSKFPPILKEWEKTVFPREKLKDYRGNRGIGTGDISGGLVVFDWDFRKGFNRKVEGFKYIFKEYKAKLGKLANTLIVETPNGYHLYYKLKGDQYKNTGKKNGGFSKTLKKFVSKNAVRFGPYLNALDTRANRGYVVCPPSKTKEGSYKWFIERTPLEIDDLDYTKIMDFFKEKEVAFHTMRLKFVDLIMGKLDPHKLKDEKHQEHVYWKEMYHEAWYCLGLKPEDLLEGLAKFQKTYNEEETKKQLENQKNIKYIYSKSRLSKEKYEDYFRINNRQELLDAFGSENPDGMILDSDLELKGRGSIMIKDNGIYLLKVFKKYIQDIQVLEGTLELEKMAYETLNNNRILISGKHDKMPFRTIPIDVILYKMNDYLYQGTMGRDVVKKYIHHLKENLNIYTLSYVLGFNSHWSLPYLEEEGKFQILTSTDKQMDAYNKCMLLPIKYKEREKNRIKKLLKLFIERTKMNKSKLSIIIGWAMAAPFRHIFIEYLDLFPVLACYGPRKTGKSAMLKFFCLTFYGVHEPYNSSVLYSMSRFEDILSTGSFPIFIEEIITVPLEILSLIKEHATMTSRFFRKKNARENDFDCLKSAPLVFDCNNAVKSLMDPATNSKLTLVPFSEDEKIPMARGWINLRRILRGYNLFSMMLDYTKDWSKDTVGTKINEYLKRDVITSEDEEKNPRILQQWVIIMFGLDLFEEVFGISLDREGFLDVIRFGRTRMTQNILVDFYSFCREAVDYDEGTEDDEGRKFRGDNPPYLSHPLEEYKSRDKGKGYFFKATNKADFQSFTKDKFTLEGLCEMLVDGLRDNHKDLISNHNTGSNRGLFIKKAFFELEIFKLYSLDELKKEYGEPPE